MFGNAPNMSQSQTNLSLLVEGPPDQEYLRMASETNKK